MLLAIFVANSTVNSVLFNSRRSHVGYQKLENVDDEAENGGELENPGKQPEIYYKKKFEEMEEEAKRVGNYDEYEKIALDFIEAITDSEIIESYFAKFIVLEKFDNEILKFFKNSSSFEKFVDHFNKRYKAINTSKNTSKTLKKNFEKMDNHLKELKATKFSNFLDKIEMCMEESYKSIYKFFEKNEALKKNSKEICGQMLPLTKAYINLEISLDEELSKALDDAEENNKQEILDKLDSIKEKENEDLKQFFDKFVKEKDSFINRQLKKFGKKKNNKNYQKLDKKEN
uniref:Uncharacterized protein n=1 Tax=Meloidogyne floridensis TaxID=298350 RepID=A0A915NIN6_9BILA